MDELVTFSNLTAIADADVTVSTVDKLQKSIASIRISYDPSCYTPEIIDLAVNTALDVLTNSILHDLNTEPRN